MGRIFVKNLLVQAAHGVAEQERRVGNTFRLSLSVEVPDSEQAMTSDCLTDTINYAEVVEIMRRSMLRPRALIEAAAGDIIRSLRETYGSKITAGTLTIEKLAPPIPAQMESVGFTVDF